ncbi:MAG: UDP-2,3-diacylglucosamine diphosphatase [Candidatus Marinimicrobia bacterium]|nr:UDP-2,3-diacylglucosamine diphosphatase [Candidatus Neomarinimicrobiota bacterium]
MDRIYFVSDAHFVNSPDQDRRQESIFRNFIKEVINRKGTLFLVGDLFDFWFEYHSCIPKYYFNTLCALKEASENGVKINIVYGNHDCWHLDFFKKFTEADLYQDSVSFQTGGKNFFVTHGDGILLSDRGYRLLKPFIRNKFTVNLIRAIHPDIANKIVRIVSSYSKGSPRNHIFTEEMEKEIERWAEKISDKGYDYIIIGHYHKPFVKELGEGKILMCIGDWLKHFTFGYFDGERLSLCYWR